MPWVRWVRPAVVNIDNIEILSVSSGYEKDREIWFTTPQMGWIEYSTIKQKPNEVQKALVERGFKPSNDFTQKVCNWLESQEA